MFTKNHLYTPDMDNHSYDAVRFLSSQSGSIKARVHGKAMCFFEKKNYDYSGDVFKVEDWQDAPTLPW
ncbi:hypothetical protein LWC34_31665 [Kibdelosporangium philippinense]|uniref:Uncharacterized protein n=1 Tax=Kibdelosporangium philippinense TaxID=211113 RepID=A0ABS8ZK46_9PSEU|nr:hypothetical protein [Kibdelosporangium philippinense]MCE7007345.1 hypothetical protein [Kibdelosporangium philippinense]